MKQSYYSKNDTLTYEPIPREQEAELFKEFYHGATEESRLAARDIILENTLRYALDLADRHCRNKSKLDEVISAANMGLMKAIESKSFDPSKGRFSTFSTKFIIGEISALFRGCHSVTFPSGKLPEMDWVPGQETDGNAVDSVQDPNGFNPSVLDFDALHTALDCLNEEERAVIELVYFGNETISETARIRGISRRWVHEVRNRAMVKLRLALGVPQRPESEDTDNEQEQAA